MQINVSLTTDEGEILDSFQTLGVDGAALVDIYSWTKSVNMDLATDSANDFINQLFLMTSKSVNPRLSRMVET